MANGSDQIRYKNNNNDDGCAIKGRTESMSSRASAAIDRTTRQLEDLQEKASEIAATELLRAYVALLGQSVSQTADLNVSDELEAESKSALLRAIASLKPIVYERLDELNFEDLCSALDLDPETSAANVMLLFRERLGLVA